MKIYVDYDDFPAIFSLAAFFYVVYILFYGRYIYSLFDPLLFYVNALAFSSVFIMNTLFVTEPIFAFHFFWCNLFFFVGFAFINYKYRIKKAALITLPSSFPDYSTFKIILYILLIVYFVSNSLQFLTQGFALLSDNPSESRITNVQNGYLILSQINSGINIFILGGLIFLILYKPTLIDAFLLVLVIILGSLTGAKSALLQLGIVLGIIVNHPMFRNSSKIRSITKLITPIVLFVMISIPFIVLGRDAGDSDSAIINFVTRLLASADSTLYFYQPINEQYFAQFHFWQYPSYLFNAILDFLRIVKGIPAHGDTMLRNVINNYNAIALGTNTPYYIEGQIYFGYYGAFLYSAVLGAIFAYSRYFFFSKKFFSIFSFILAVCIIDNISALFVEATAAAFSSFLTFFFVLPIYFFVNFIVQNKIILRVKTRYLNIIGFLSK